MTEVGATAVTSDEETIFSSEQLSKLDIPSFSDDPLKTFKNKPKGSKFH